ncbi:pre-mRNA cleavage complex 2 protein Pcf11 isoform X2 [Eucyclogobius newberryi]|uniref:pre-mRNA cleavage complex 2 protein Pcf11 isoform X2 n=1 Tax=Eucyclogobius newberryi TaxID=166745 RepID=UPI003B59A2BC
MDCAVIRGAAAGGKRTEMEDAAAREDACREYESSLEDLTFNSKPHINMLTILAEENIAFARDIVGIIEAQISKAPAQEKLPVLYLVDSIVKNVGRDYLPVFAKNLITSFICVFEKVDENTRKSLFKLRSTWDEVFPSKKLYALDVRVNSVDPAWPIKPLPPAVNSIHVNPKFLKQPDETSPARPAPAPTAPPPVAAPVDPVSSLTQEQLIRQQLLAKQKQLLELQQKKIELELEQTKAQLAGGFVLPTSTISSLTPKAIVPQTTVIRPWIPPQGPSAEAKAPAPASTNTPSAPAPSAPAPSAPAPSAPALSAPAPASSAPAPASSAPAPAPSAPAPAIRDPRLNRPTSKELKNEVSSSAAADRKHFEKHGKVERARAPRPDALDKSKSKSPSPLTKSVPSRNNKSLEEKKDPRLKKRTQEKPENDDPREKRKREDDSKDLEDLKKKRDEASKKSKLENGSMATKEDFKLGGNARTHARKRSRSPDSLSPKRNTGRGGSKEKDRRSPKSSCRARSSSPSPHKGQKNPRARSREDRGVSGLKKSLNDRRKRGPDDRDSPRGHDPASKESKDAAHRWKSGWEDTKHGKEEPHKSMTPRHKAYPSPRTAKHRLSVDANLQIPDVLNSASKKDLLRLASKRLENGEISEEEFLNLAHKIKHLFQYQEEKQQQRGERRSKERDEPPQPMIEDYNHGKEFPPLKSLPGLRFKRRVDPRDTADREWISPLSERHRLDGEVKSGYDRRFPERRADPPSLNPQEPPRFERERLSPLPPPHPVAREQPDSSPVPRFESPNSEHSEEGPLEPGPPQNLQNLQPKSILKTRHDGPERGYNDKAPGNRQQGWVESGPRFDSYDPEQRFDGPRFDPPSRFNSPEHFDHMTHSGPMRGFDGPSPRPQGPVRFEPPMQRFDGPQRFNNSMGPMGFQPIPQRFEGPFDGPESRPRPGFDGPRFEHRYAPQQHPPVRSLGPSMFDGPMAPQQGFNMGPNNMGPNNMGPNNMGPNNMGPNNMGPNNMGPSNMGPSNMGPSNMGPSNMGPNNMGPNNMGPQHFSEPVSGPFPPAAPMFQGPNFGQPGPFTQPQGGFYPQAPGPGLQQPMNNMNQPFMPQNTVPFPQAAPAPENHFGQVDVNDLLSKLISTGIIKGSQPEGPASQAPGGPPVAPAAPPVVEEEEDEEEPAEDDLPDLTSFILDTMKHRYESVVTRLYTGNQCCLCSMRFTAAQTDLYADHLDWHFRQNHAGKVAAKKITHRRWYYGLTDWVEFEEIADLEERAKSTFFEKENEEEVQKTQAAAKEKEFQSVRATKDQVAELCEICQEPFETYWVEEEEDWFLKNALRVDDKNFHPACFEDYQNSSYLEATPSPHKHLEHPLSALRTDDVKVKIEDEGGASCCVKQEVDSEPKQEVTVKEEPASS